MHRIKIKSPTEFSWNEQIVFVGGSISFQSALTLAVLQWQKSLPDIGGTTIQDVGPLTPMEPGVHTMSNELILQISCNIFLGFKWILMMRSGHNISHYTTAKLLVHVWNHDLIWWQNKIDTQKHFHKNTISSFETLSKTKIPITMVKAQTLSKPFQKSRTAGWWHPWGLWLQCDFQMLSNMPHCFEGVRIMFMNRPWANHVIAMNIHNLFLHCATSQYVFKPREFIMLMYDVTIVAA